MRATLQLNHCVVSGYFTQEDFFIFLKAITILGEKKKLRSFLVMSVFYPPCKYVNLYRSSFSTYTLKNCYVITKCDSP